MIEVVVPGVAVAAVVGLVLYRRARSSARRSRGPAVTARAVAKATPAAKSASGTSAAPVSPSPEENATPKPGRSTRLRDLVTAWAEEHDHRLTWRGTLRVAVRPADAKDPVEIPLGPLLERCRRFAPAAWPAVVGRHLDAALAVPAPVEVETTAEADAAERTADLAEDRTVEAPTPPSPSVPVARAGGAAAERAVDVVDEHGVERASTRGVDPTDEVEVDARARLAVAILTDFAAEVPSPPASGSWTGLHDVLPDVPLSGGTNEAGGIGVAAASKSSPEPSLVPEGVPPAVVDEALDTRTPLDDAAEAVAAEESLATIPEFAAEPVAPPPAGPEAKSETEAETEAETVPSAGDLTTPEEPANFRLGVITVPPGAVVAASDASAERAGVVDLAVEVGADSTGVAAASARVGAESTEVVATPGEAMADAAGGVAAAAEVVASGAPVVAAVAEAAASPAESAPDAAGRATASPEIPSGGVGLAPASAESAAAVSGSLAADSGRASADPATFVAAADSAIEGAMPAVEATTAPLEAAAPASTDELMVPAEVALDPCAATVGHDGGAPLADVRAAPVTPPEPVLSPLSAGEFLESAPATPTFVDGVPAPRGTSAPELASADDPPEPVGAPSASMGATATPRDAVPTSADAPPASPDVTVVAPAEQTIPDDAWESLVASGCLHLRLVAPSSAPGADRALRREDAPGTVTILGCAVERAPVDLAPSALADFGVDAATAFDAALAALRDRARPPSSIENVDGVALHVIDDPDDPAVAAELLVLDRWPEFFGKGGALVAVPTQHVLVALPVSAGLPASALRLLVALSAATFEERVAPLSPHVYWHDGTTLRAPLTRRDGARLAITLPDELDAFLAL